VAPTPYQIPPEDTSADVNPVAGDRDRLHRRQVDYQTAVADCQTWDAVPAAAHGQRQPVVPGEQDCRGYLLGVAAADDECRSPVDSAVPD
jgi:hypothetical protein